MPGSAGIPGGPKLHRTPVPGRSASQAPRSVHGTPLSNARSLRSGQAAAAQHQLAYYQATPGSHGGPHGTHRLARTPGSVRFAAAAYPMDADVTADSQVGSGRVEGGWWVVMAAAGFRHCVSGAARLRPARSWGQEAVALRSGTHSPGCTALSADPWRSQAGTHPHGPHPRHRWPAGSAWLCCGAALSRLRPRRALCGSARQRVPAALPRLCCGSAPRWADAPVRAAAHDIPGWCTSRELAGWFPVAKPCMHAGQQCRLLNRLPGLHSQPLPQCGPPNRLSRPALNTPPMPRCSPSPLPS